MVIKQKLSRRDLVPHIRQMQCFLIAENNVNILIEQFAKNDVILYKYRTALAADRQPVQPPPLMLKTHSWKISMFPGDLLT